MSEALRDPVWQFVGVLLALLSLGAAFWIYWLQRQIREIAFGLVWSSRPVAIADELSSRVTVHLDGTPVSNLHLLVYGLKNSGHRAVGPADFERPLSLAFPLGQVISAELASQRPANLGGSLLVSSSRVELVPLLLNPGDQLLIQILLSSVDPTSIVDARVVDVPSFAPINATPKPQSLFKSGALVLVVMPFIIGMVAMLQGNDWAAYALFGIGLPVVMIELVRSVIEHGRGSARRRLDA